MKKKLLAIVMALTMIFTLMPTNYALAATDGVNALVATNKTSKTARKSKTVSTEKALKAALKSKAYKSITISTRKKVNFTIPKGKYTTKTLTVNAPKSDVKNYGKFKSITIKAIAKNTWKENANGNTIKLTCAAGRVVLSKDKKIKQLIIDRRDMNIDLVVTGDVDEIVVDSTSKVNIRVTGSVGKITVNKRTEVNITGTSDSQIPIEVNAGADGTAFSTTVPVNISTSANTELTANAGAEGSSVKINDASKKVEVANNSASPVSVTRTDGTETAIENGKNDIVSGEEVKVPAETPASGSSVSKPASDPAITPVQPPQPVTVPESTSQPSTSQSGSGSTATSSNEESSSSSGSSTSESGSSSSSNEPSHDLSRYIRQFSYQPQITAGVFGTTLKSVDEIMKELPTSISQKASDGTTVTFPVTKWNNTDNYSTNSPVGNYSFTADLGTPTPDCIVEDGAKAVVKVCVLASGSLNIQTNDESLKNLEKTGEEQVGKFLIITIKNSNNINVSIRGQLNVYKNGNLQKSSYDKYAVIKAGDEQKFAYDVEGVTYDAYTLNLNAYSTYDAISSNEISAAAGEYDESKHGIPITLTNNSSMYVKGCYYAVILKLNGEVVLSTENIATDIPSGETKQYNQYLESRWNSETQKEEHIAYDDVEVYPLNISTVVESAYNGNSKLIVNTDNSDLKDIEKVSEELTGKYLIITIKNNNEKNISIRGQLNVYKDGILQKSSYDKYAVIKEGDEQKFAYDVDGVTYDAYTLNINAYSTDDAINSNEISAAAGEYDESKHGIPITLTNNSNMYVKSCYYAVILKLNGEVVLSTENIATDIPSGETKQYNQYLESRWNSETQKEEHIAYDDVEVYPLNISSVAKSGNNENNQLVVITNEGDLKDIEKVSEEMNGKYLIITIKNNNEKNVSIRGQLNVYKDGSLQKSSYDKYAVIKAGDEQKVAYDVDGVSYDAYTLDVNVYSTDDAINSNEISATASEYDESKHGIPITITNNSGMYIKCCYYAVILKLNGEVVLSTENQATDIPSGETKQYSQYLENRWNSETQKEEHTAYASVEVYILNITSVSK